MMPAAPRPPPQARLQQYQQPQQQQLQQQSGQPQWNGLRRSERIAQQRAASAAALAHTPNAHTVRRVLLAEEVAAAGPAPPCGQLGPDSRATVILAGGRSVPVLLVSGAATSALSVECARHLGLTVVKEDAMALAMAECTRVEAVGTAKLELRLTPSAAEATRLKYQVVPSLADDALIVPPSALPLNDIRTNPPSFRYVGPSPDIRDLSDVALSEAAVQVAEATREAARAASEAADAARNPLPTENEPEDWVSPVGINWADLTSEQARAVKRVVYHWREAFCGIDEHPARTQEFIVQLVAYAKPYAREPRPVSAEKDAFIQQTLAKWLLLGLIEPST